MCVIVWKRCSRTSPQAFAEDLTSERFATFVAVVCEEGNDQLELLSAGHAPIFVYSSYNQSLRLMDAQALPLGIFPDLWDAVPVKLSMQPGDIVLLVTDGFLNGRTAPENSSAPIGSPQQ